MVVGHAATGLNRGRVNTRDVHLLLNDHPVGTSLGKGCISSRTVACLPVVYLIRRLLVLFIRTQQWSIGIKRLFGTNEHMQRLVINLDSSDAIRGSVAT